LDNIIPKRIIQIWGGGLDLPLLSRAAAANIRLLNPEFEYLFFDDQGMANFIDERVPQHRNVFRSFRNPVQRYDFFRYLAIYNLGGFYFDIDFF
jgi:mannosyltransferase OCH1-like enzyme